MEVRRRLVGCWFVAFPLLSADLVFPSDGSGTLIGPTYWISRTPPARGQEEEERMETAPQTVFATDVQAGRALTIERYFTTVDVHPFDTVEWESRTAAVGSFRQDDVEFPSTWSQNATNIVTQKYFRGQMDSPARERSVKQMISRVSGTIADWGRQRGYFATAEDGDAFQDELTFILLHQLAAFNSPVWFNVGFEEQPQCSACFILSVEDTMESILDWNTREGKIFRGGSGSGINLSNIRGSMEPLSKGGTASGPVSFMRGADSWAGTIKSGGKTRRAAKMVVLDVDHPDILEFVQCKAKEEDKAEALAKAGFDMSIDGDGFTSIQYQNANNSVRVSDDFMQAVVDDAEWQTTPRNPDAQEVKTPSFRARKLMNEIAKAAWRCADPGMQYDTTINRWHTSPNSGRINASNPCSEYMHVD
ncbi:MAG: vitamin B12-dependent ribonucleotide reductase, partial [Conexibacter sp.]|nr:vitamin B12-dependent ribonucleotide reductase [Conexibacter sp.]